MAAPARGAGRAVAAFLDREELTADADGELYAILGPVVLSSRAVMVPAPAGARFSRVVQALTAVDAIDATTAGGIEADFELALTARQANSPAVSRWRLAATRIGLGQEPPPEVATSCPGM